MEKIFNKVCCLFSLFFFACSPSVENGIKIIGMGDSYALYIDGKETMGHRTKRFFQWSGKMGERF